MRINRQVRVNTYPQPKYGRCVKCGYTLRKDGSCWFNPAHTKPQVQVEERQMELA